MPYKKVVFSSMEHAYEPPKWVVLVITNDNNRHYRGFDDFETALEYRDHALDNANKVMDAYIFEKTNH